jgi:two-component system cell cycle response regulator
MPRTVLIIDDSEVVRAKLEETLRAQRIFDQFLHAGNGIDGFKLLLGQPVDLILCDLIMPGIDGFKFLSLKHSRPEFKEVPVIMLTGEEDVKAKVRGFDAGASDYLTKPFHAEELAARVKVHLKIKSLQDELREKHARLETLTRTDELTGLNNRRFFMENLRHEYARSLRYQTPMAFAMVDIDHFKRVNDTHGHLAGDRALVAVAATLVAALRTQDIVGRYGGEEFAVILPQTGVPGAELGLERCRRLIAEAPVALDNAVLQVTVSIGVVHYPRADVTRLEDLIGRADEALYKAKDAGRNRVVTALPPTVYEPPPKA